MAKLGNYFLELAMIRSKKELLNVGVDTETVENACKKTDYIGFRRLKLNKGGYCVTTYARRTKQPLKHTITVNSALNDERFTEDVQDIVTHELLHACFPFDKHDGNWKHYADKLGIGQYTTDKVSKALRTATPKYLLKDLTFGNEYKYQRKGDIVRVAMEDGDLMVRNTYIAYDLYMDGELIVEHRM